MKEAKTHTRERSTSSSWFKQFYLLQQHYNKLKMNVRVKREGNLLGAEWSCRLLWMLLRRRRSCAAAATALGIVICFLPSHVRHHLSVVLLERRQLAHTTAPLSHPAFHTTATMFCCFPVSLIIPCLIGMWMLLWPVTASVWGVFAVSRQSVILMLYLLISNHCRCWCNDRLVSNEFFSLVASHFLLFPPDLGGEERRIWSGIAFMLTIPSFRLHDSQGQVASFVSRLLDLLILVVLLMQPVTIMPEFGIEIYSYVMTIVAEPVFVWMETAALIRVICRIGDRISRLVFADSGESLLIKSLIILLTIAIYYFSMRILVTGMSVAPSPVFTQ